MAGIRIGGIYIALDLKTEGVVRGSRTATQEMRRLRAAQRRLRGEARKLNRILSSQAALIGGVGAAYGAVRSITGFETSMSRIEGLVGVAGDKVAELTQGVLELAPAVGRLPTELAEALFFITSAGARGKTALDILDKSAKAAAAGLGETKVVADAATSAMNAYGAENLSAGKAVGILTAAIRVGKLEAETLAPVLGRITGLAAELGIEFHEVAAGVAALSLGGQQASEGITGLVGIIKILAKPSEQAKKALEELGTPIEKLRELARDDGLLKVITDLKDAADAKNIDLGLLFRDVQGLNALFQLTGKNAEKVQLVFDALAKAGVKDLETAFAVAAETTQFKFVSALAEIQKTIIKLSKNTLPDVIRALGWLREHVEEIIKVFAGLVAYKVAAYFGGLAATVAAAIAPLWNLRRAVLGTASAMAILQSINPVGAIATLLSVGVGVGVYHSFDAILESNKERLAALNDEIAAVKANIAEMQNAKEGYLLAEARSGGIATATKQLKRLEEARRKLNEQVVRDEQVAIDLEGINLALDDLDTAVAKVDEVDDKVQALADGTGDALANAFGDFITSAENAQDAVRGLIAELANLILRQTVLNPLAAGVSSWLQGFGASFGATSAPATAGATPYPHPLTPPAATRLYARGGEVGVGDRLIVGEQGPELFIPGADGLIQPLARASAPVINQHFSYRIESTDGPGVARALAEARPLMAEDAKRVVQNELSQPSALARQVRRG